MKWYRDKYRRHLLDMHIDDWNDDFLSRFSAEEYYKNIKTANVQVVMIYLQSHIGLCYFPTKIGRMHKAFSGRENEIKRLIDMCRADGISVVGYYSLSFNQWAHDNHKDWRMLEENGKSCRENDKANRCGLCCPNNMGYREFVFRQIDEMLNYFDMDGMFFDMLYWQHICYCPSCREKYLKTHGKELPFKKSCTNKEWLEFMDARAEWISEWAQAVTDYVHSVKPELPIEHNFSAATGGFESCCRDGVAYASEYVGGDLYGGPLEQSFVCSTYRDLTRNQPFEYMTGRCTPNLLAHTVTKSKDELEQQIMITCAHHGAFLAIDAIDPVGTMDERFYELLGKLYDKESKYEPYLRGELVEDIGVFYNLDSAINLQGNQNGVQFLHFGKSLYDCENRTASLQAIKHLIAEHIPFGITTKGKKDEWSKYRVIVAPEINRLAEDVEEALIKYVKNGGNLYFSGCYQKRLFDTLVGGDLVKYSKTQKVYMFPTDSSEDLMPKYNEKYPIPLDTSVPFVEGIANENILAYIKTAYTDRGDAKTCASFHSDPPGISTKYPAIVEKNYGKGKVIWSVAPVEFHKAPDYRDLFVKILSRLDSTPYTVSSTANSMVEIISFKDENKITLSAVNMVNFEQLFTLPPFIISVRTEAPVKSVKHLPSGESIFFEAGEDTVTFTVENLKIMEMYQIEF